MMYIAINDLSIDATWQSEAAKAARAVANAAPEARSKIINDHQDVWKKLKQQLRDFSHQKCWYCESIDTRSDNAVDHYRPKGNVKDSNPPHTGYWWLAFDWNNYRFSCQFCNSIRNSETTSGGKQDYFPLVNESARARTDADDIILEQPLLLDPTDPIHVLLIAFSDDGSVGPTSADEHHLDYKMAKVTITRYHLDHPTLVEKRAVLLREVRNVVEEADRYLERQVTNPDPYLYNAAKSRMKQIIAAKSRRAVYSAAVNHLLTGMATRSEAARRALKSP